MGVPCQFCEGRFSIFYEIQRFSLFQIPFVAHPLAMSMLHCFVQPPLWNAPLAQVCNICLWRTAKNLGRYTELLTFSVTFHLPGRMLSSVIWMPFLGCVTLIILIRRQRENPVVVSSQTSFVDGHVPVKWFNEVYPFQYTFHHFSNLQHEYYNQMNPLQIESHLDDVNEKYESDNWINWNCSGWLYGNWEQLWPD